MKKLSQFTHLIHIERDTYALWNSLWLRVLFISGTHVQVIQRALENKQLLDNRLLGRDETAFIEALAENHYLESSNDTRKITQVRELLRNQPVGILYLIMTEGCNLACGYCFLKEMIINQKALENTMSFTTARSYIDMFVRLVQTNKAPEPTIIFYGGEPFINWPVMEQVIRYIRQVLPDCEINVITNGTLITDEVCKSLAENDVQVVLSCDGKNHDHYRINKSGKGSLKEVLRALKLMQKHKVIVGLSCTVTDANVETLHEDTLWFLDVLGAEFVDFNILLGDSIEVEDYQKLASSQILRCFEIARERGIPVDRVMRRVDAYSEGRLNLVDCGGCGQQMVGAPDGSIGCCHAFLNTKDNFFPQKEMGNIESHELWQQLKQRSPFNIAQCLNCEALGICGGGCFYNAFLQKGSVWEVDDTHCALVKETLQFLLQDTLKNTDLD